MTCFLRSKTPLGAQDALPTDDEDDSDDGSDSSSDVFTQMPGLAAADDPAVQSSLALDLFFFTWTTLFLYIPVPA